MRLRTHGLRLRRLPGLIGVTESSALLFGDQQLECALEQRLEIAIRVAMASQVSSLLKHVAHALTGREADLVPLLSTRASSGRCSTARAADGCASRAWRAAAVSGNGSSVTLPESDTTSSAHPSGEACRPLVSRIFRPRKICLSDRRLQRAQARWAPQTPPSIDRTHAPLLALRDNRWS
jgi:hypothetical protein